MLGHISTPEGKKVLRLSGLWNSRLDMVPCDEEGEALPDATPTNLWTVGHLVHALLFLCLSVLLLLAESVSGCTAAPGGDSSAFPYGLHFGEMQPIGKSTRITAWCSCVPGHRLCQKEKKEKLLLWDSALTQCAGSSRPGCLFRMVGAGLW